MTPRTKELGLGLLTSVAYIIGAIFFFGAVSSAINRDTRFELIDRWELAIELAPIVVVLVAALVQAARWWKPERWKAIGLLIGIALPIALIVVLWLRAR